MYETDMQDPAVLLQLLKSCQQRHYNSCRLLNMLQYISHLTWKENVSQDRHGRHVKLYMLACWPGQLGLIIVEVEYLLPRYTR